MNVLFEASWLGVGYKTPSAMRGIFRVISEVLRHSAQEPSLLVSACADTNAMADYWGRVAVKEMHLLPDERWVSTWRHVLPAVLLTPNQGLPSVSWSRRIFRKMATKTSWRAPAKGEWDIFHSLFYPLGHRSAHQARARFLMIYDLLPIKFPEFYGASAHYMRETHARIAQSPDPEKDWVTCISASAKADLCEFTGIAAERVFVTPLAAGPEFFSVQDPEKIRAVRRKYQIPPAPYILSLCALAANKNLAHLIRSFVRLLMETKNEDWHLVLAGEHGSEIDRLLAEIKLAEGYRHRILCPGHIADEDLAALYSGAEVFVFPSLYEGFGLPPLEAMQCGLPVITSNTSSLPEVVGDAGMMVSPTDTDALCAAMLRVLEDARLRQEMRGRGLLRAAQFSWPNTVAALTEAYRTALAQN